MATKKKATEKVAEENEIVSEIVSEETVAETQEVSEEAPEAEAVPEKTPEQENAEKVISGPKTEKRKPVSATVSDEEGVIGSRGAAKKSAPKVEEAKVEEKSDKVAVWSPRHIHAGRLVGLPSLQPGYNFMSRKDADGWITLKKDVREATPEEVAKHFGV